MIVKSNSNDPVLATLALETIDYGPKYDQTIKDPYNSGPIVNPSTLPGGTQPTQNKWNWGGFWKGIVKSLPFGGTVVTILENAGVWKQNAGVSDTELQIVNEWLNDNFYSFINQQAGAADAIIKTGTLTLSNLPVFNELLSKLCIIKTHFSQNDGSLAVSQAALQVRYDAIASVCDAIASSISSKVASSGLSLQLSPIVVNSANFDFGDMTQNLGWDDFNCFNYVSSPVKSTTVITEIPLTTTVKTPTTPTPKKDNQLRNIMLIGFGTVAVILLLKDKKSTN